MHGLAERILDALDIDLDLVADLERPVAAGAGEFLERDAAFGLQTDVDDRDILLDRDDLALDDGPFAERRTRRRFIEKRGEILAGRVMLQAADMCSPGWADCSRPRRRVCVSMRFPGAESPATSWQGRRS